MVIIVAAPEARASPELRTRSIEFKGFSRNERLAAFIATETYLNDMGELDTLVLGHAIMLQGTRGVPERVGLYILHLEGSNRTRHNKKLPTSAWYNRYPQLKQAFTAQAWRKLQRQAHFARLRAPLDDDSIRIRPAPGQQFAAKSSKASIEMHTLKGGTPGIHYNILVRRFDGAHRESPGLNEPLALRATMQAYASRSTFNVAFINSAELSKNGSRRVASLSLLQFKNYPLGSIVGGFLKDTKQNMRRVRDHYKNLHPEGTHAYEQFTEGVW